MTEQPFGWTERAKCKEIYSKPCLVCGWGELIQHRAGRLFTYLCTSCKATWEEVKRKRKVSGE
jgi:hypothetical protein